MFRCQLITVLLRGTPLFTILLGQGKPIGIIVPRVLVVPVESSREFHLYKLAPTRTSHIPRVLQSRNGARRQKATQNTNCFSPATSSSHRSCREVFLFFGIAHFSVQDCFATHHLQHKTILRAKAYEPPCHLHLDTTLNNASF